ncbi:sodium-dependent phosphate transport protein 2A-like [Amphiura filiformis]|uniref:sodium-dependent phosphate transport protein 2A-like n=1 Tax=Amphiura filiformis TaxID=82378 RepID=UPI003B20D1D5
MDNQNIRPSMEEDPIPSDPPPPYESPKKTEIIWDIREVDDAATAAQCIKIEMGVDQLDDVPEIIKKAPVTENTDMLPQILKLKKADDPWALSEIEMGTKWCDLSTAGKIKRVVFDWFTKPILIVSLLYFFICSLDLMSSAFRLLGGKEAGEVFGDNKLLQNPICGLMIGILATVLVQSSSTSTSIVVSIVAAGILPVKPAIFIIMGANIGTSVTNTIVSLAHSGNRIAIRRAFGGATIHDMFNWLSVIILLPMEVATSYLYHLTRIIVDKFNIKTNGEVNVELLKKLTKPFSKKIVQIDSKMIQKVATGEIASQEANLLKVWCKKDMVAVNITQLVNGTNETAVEYVSKGTEKCHYLLANTGLTERAVGAILLVCSLAALCICLVCMVKLLNSVLKGRMAGIIKKTINADFPGPLKYLTGYFAICVGAVVTFLVQSSSVFTSAMTPLVGIGVITLERMFPLTLGSNIGTTATGILASLASSGNKLDNSIQIALCHLFFNISGILIWYPIPVMRKVPINMAKMLGNTTAKYRWFAFFYLLMMFFVLPVSIFGLSMISIWALAGVGIPVILLATFVVIVNVLQCKKPHVLPKKLQSWAFLPEPLRSLDPLDRALTRIGALFRSCCPCSKSQQPLSAMPFNLNGSSLLVQYDPLSTSSTPRTMSTNPSCNPSAMPSASTSLECLAVPHQTSV